MSSSKTNALIYSTIVAMGGLIFGLDAALIAGTVDAITKEFSLSSLELGTAVSAPAWGVLVALPFMGIICNNFGRKKAIILIAILYVVSAVTSAFAPNYWVLVGARFLGGLAFSSISLASMYIGEIAPPKLRGKLVSMIQINIVIGLSGAYFINYMLHSWSTSGAEWVTSLGLAENTWRWMLGSEIPFAIVWFFLLLGIPESPSWLFLRGRVEDAKETLRKILPANEIEPHIEEMNSSVQKSSKNHSILSQLVALFSKRMRLIFVIAFALGIAQQTTGINAILFYAQTVFKQLGIGENAAFAQSVWVGLNSIVFTVLGLLLVDKLGRRPLIIWGMVWIIASLGVCSYAFKQARYTISDETIASMAEVENIDKLAVIAGVEFENDIDFKDAVKAAIGDEEAAAHMASLQQSSTEMNAVLVLIGILSFVAAFHFSVGPVMWVLFSEIFPISVRAIAIPFFTIITSVTSAVVQWFFPWQLDNMGMSTIFLFYASTVSVGLLVMFFTLKETKGMSIEEIEASYTNGG